MAYCIMAMCIQIIYLIKMEFGSHLNAGSEISHVRPIFQSAINMENPKRSEWSTCLHLQEFLTERIEMFYEFFIVVKVAKSFG